MNINREELLLARVLANIQVSETGCWLWQGYKDRWGYAARVKIDGRRHLLHRWMYQHYRGSIPEGLCIDHLCRVRHCINPDHLEVVTKRENTLRGETYPARNVKKTHCPKGHPYTSENTRVRKNGARLCITCIKAYDHKRVRRRGKRSA